MADAIARLKICQRAGNWEASVYIGTNQVWMQSFPEYQVALWHGQRAQGFFLGGIQLATEELQSQITEQEATIQRLKSRLDYWAELLETRYPRTQPIVQEMRITADQL